VRSCARMRVHVCVFVCVCECECVCVCKRGVFWRTRERPYAHTCIRTENRTLFTAMGSGVVGSQAFNYASAFNQNLASWNVLRATSFTGMWTGANALSDCNEKAIYTSWGTTFQAAWPTFNAATCTVGTMCTTCITNSNIGAAVTAWVTDPTTATTTYGDIVDWNTASVTSMASLFKMKPTFNADISKWNVASVANMYQVCANKIELSLVLTYPCVVGSQAFYSASAFNANIGAWNTAHVTTLKLVCAVSAVRRAPVAHSVSVCCMCTCACTRIRYESTTLASMRNTCGRLAGVLLCVGGQREHRRVEHGVRDDVVLCMQPCRRFVGFCWRPGLCAAALPRRRAHARMCVRFHRRGPRAVGSQAFYYASAFNVNIGAWNTASVATLDAVCNL
jgi:hypothetical protein